MKKLLPLFALFFYVANFAFAEPRNLDEEKDYIATLAQKFSSTIQPDGKMYDAVAICHREGNKYHNMHDVWKVIMVLSVTGTKEAVDLKNRIILSGLIGSNTILERAGFSWNASRKLNTNEMYCWQNQQANYLIERAYYAECADYTPMMSDESRQTIENAFFETEEKGKRTYNMWRDFENMKAQRPHAVGEMYQRLMFFTAEKDADFARQFAQEEACLTYLEFARTLITPIHVPVEPINTQPEQEEKQQPQKKEPLVNKFEEKIQRLKRNIKSAGQTLERETKRIAGQIQHVADNPRVQKTLDNFERSVNRGLKKFGL